jgi:hypothetical protein
MEERWESESQCQSKASGRGETSLPTLGGWITKTNQLTRGFDPVDQVGFFSSTQCRASNSNLLSFASYSPARETYTPRW